MPFVGSKEFRVLRQTDDHSCVAKSVESVLDFYNNPRSERSIRKAIGTDVEGTNMGPTASYLRSLGYTVSMHKNIRLKTLTRLLKQGPVIVHVDGDHAAPVFGADEAHFWIADPSWLRCPFRRQSRRAFLARWDRWAMSIRPSPSSTMMPSRKKQS